MKNSRATIYRRLQAVLLSSALMLPSFGVHGATITPTLAEVPLQGLNPVKPNIMFTLDDSGSMAWDFMPDYAQPGTANVAGTVLHCRDKRECGSSSALDPPLRSSAYNGIYYDPETNYTAGVRSDGTALPCEGSDGACGSPWTAVYSDGFASYPASNRGGSINLTTNYPDTVWCNTTKTPTSNQIHTAITPALGGTGTGTDCRLNGIPYPVDGNSPNLSPAITAGHNYPNAKSPTTGANTTCPANNAKCMFTRAAAVTLNPYYFTVASVEFCPTQDAAGWGTGACTANWNSTLSNYVRFGGGSFSPTAFTRVDIRPTGFVVNGVNAPNPTGRTYAAEMANVAKWYAFYRTRILAMKAAGGIAFSALDSNSRVGFHTINYGGSSDFLNINAFDVAQKASWFAKLYGASASGGTPLPAAMWRIGQYFSNLQTGISGASDPLDATTGRCQPNFHLMSTDGYWNALLPNGSINPYDQDQTVPNLPNLPGNTGFAIGAVFPSPYYEGPAGTSITSNTLADIAMNYWLRDLRPALADNVKDAVAPWQHVVFYGLSIGARGNIAYPNGIVGLTSWPRTLTSPSGSSSDPAAIDDLWHAAVNGHGKYFNAQNAQQLAESIVSSLADFTDQEGTGTAVGIAGAQLSTTAKYAYQTSYAKGWTGDLRKYPLDLDTGQIPLDASGNLVAPIWSAATRLDQQVAVVPGPPVVNGWDVVRKIVTLRDDTNAVVPFRLGSLSPAQQSSLNAGWTSVAPQPTAQSVLDYLRGDASNEGVGSTNFRVRGDGADANVLGDIVYSAAVPVGAPNLPYEDAGNPGYTAFKAAKVNRTPMVYVGANDGMLHAFSDSATVADAGKETWAFVPRAMFAVGNPNDTAHAVTADFQIGALTYRRGGIPLFHHRFYVNATPRVWDIDVANTNTATAPQSGNDWRTILVGGLGAGGRAVYALDVTNPVASSETEASVAASSRVLWEYKEANLGYVFDAPTLVKTRAKGWVALVVSGYNNPGGKGFLYVLNPYPSSKSGELIAKIPLPGDTGTDAYPTGLSTVRAYTLSRKDPYALQAYGGDLNGNIWRFDLSGNTVASWKAERIAALTDAGGKKQPVTTGVRIEIDQNNNVDRYIFVGTGRLLDQPDMTDTSVYSSMYVIRDGTRTTPDAAPATPWSRADLNAVSETSIVGFVTPAAGTRGWYQDATSADQKIVTDVYADVQTAVYAFAFPSADPCEAIMQARLFARDYSTGTSVLTPAGGGNVVASIFLTSGIAGARLVQGRPGSGGYESGEVRLQVTSLDGQVFTFAVNLTSAISARHRVSWRLFSGN